MTDPRHPPLEILALYALDPRGAGRGVRRHVEAPCLTCREVTDSMRALVGGLREAVAGDAPEELVTRWSRLFSPQRRRGPLFVMADLVRDSRSLVGARGIPTNERYLLFRSSEIEIDVRLLPLDGGHLDLRGQVHGPGNARLNGIEVRVLDGSSPLGVVATDRFGAFHLPRLASPPDTFQFLGREMRIQAQLPAPKA